MFECHANKLDAKFGKYVGRNGHLLASTTVAEPGRICSNSMAIMPGFVSNGIVFGSNV